MASLTAVNHILPSTHFQNVELVIQIIAIKISQSRAGLIKKNTYANSPQIYRSFIRARMWTE